MVSNDIDDKNGKDKAMQEIKIDIDSDTDEVKKLRDIISIVVNLSMEIIDICADVCDVCDV